MVMVNVFGLPEQLVLDGVTVMVAVCVPFTFDATKLILPLPEEPSPILVLELVQEYEVALLPLKITVTCVPPHSKMLEGWSTVGRGTRVIVPLTDVPEAR